MGVETALLVVAGVAEGAKAYTQYESAQSQDQALDMQAEQQQLQTQQKTLSNLDAVQKVLDAQEAAESVRGVSFSSPSFNAIQRATINIGSKAQSNIDIEGDLEQANIDIEKQNVKNTLYGQLFGDASDLALGGMNVYNSAPKSGS